MKEAIDDARNTFLGNEEDESVQLEDYSKGLNQFEEDRI